MEDKKLELRKVLCDYFNELTQEISVCYSMLNKIYSYDLTKLNEELALEDYNLCKEVHTALNTTDCILIKLRYEDKPFTTSELSAIKYDVLFCHRKLESLLDKIRDYKESEEGILPDIPYNINATSIFKLRKYQFSGDLMKEDD